MHRILILNLGSTSFKFKLYDMGEGENLLAAGSVESIGAQGRCRVLLPDGVKHEMTCACADHAEGLEICMQALSNDGVLRSLSELDAVAYKAVHGGSISGSRRVDDALLAEMERMTPFAPAHNPVYLSMMRSVRRKYPQLIQIACFETTFHQTVPLKRSIYGVPYEWVEEYGLRRYGFHGSSHSYIAWKIGQLSPDAKRVISVHLGGSCSLCAIHNGQSVATSMGTTPQSGLFHNNRVGDLDVFCLPMLTERLGGLEGALKALSQRSGLLGLSGVSNDMRAVEAAAEAGNDRAQLALDAFADEIIGYIGMYTAYLGGLDAVVFTGGIGTNDWALRRQVCEGLGFLGAALDDSLNRSCTEGKLSTPESRVEIWALETNEELMIARQTRKLLEQGC